MRKTKAKVPVPTTSLPHPLYIMRELLPKLRLPEGDFDPSGEWEHRYTMWMSLLPHAGPSHASGTLTIRRSGIKHPEFWTRGEGDRSSKIANARPAIPGESLHDKETELTVKLITTMKRTRQEEVEATQRCLADTLSSPVQWRISSHLEADLVKLDLPYVKDRAEVEDGKVWRYGHSSPKMKIGKQYTSNWSLFDVVQRLPFDTKTLEFDMIEDLELLKPNQRLSPGPAVDVEIGGRKMKLHSFEQIGQGILPYTYWLDDKHRLIIAAGALKSFILDPEGVLTGGTK